MDEKRLLALIFAPKAEDAERLLEGKACWREKRGGFFSQGAKGGRFRIVPLWFSAAPHNPLMRPGGTHGTPVEREKMAKVRG